MNRIFLDTNVILDLLGERVPFYDSIAKVATLADQKNNDIEISPFVKSLSSGIDIPADYDYKKERADYLDQKYK